MTVLCFCGATVVNGHHCENGHLQFRDAPPMRLEQYEGRIYTPVEQPPSKPKYSALAAKWLYDRPLLTINERSVVARFAEWLDERDGSV